MRATPPSPHFSVRIGRALGTVVVTVHGVLDDAGAAQLGGVLNDLIDGQGNLKVVVDLRDVHAVHPSGVSTFAVAGRRAQERGGLLTLSDPPDILYRALELRGRVQLTATVSRERHREPTLPPSRSGRSSGGRYDHPAGGPRQQQQGA
jgi:anti-anti-sigma regulatory factor